MNLANRLYSERVAIANGKRICFQFHGLVFYSYSDLIQLVMNRFARRFGVIYRDKANTMHERLANKYCEFPSRTLQALYKAQTEAFIYKPPYLYPSDEVRKFINTCIDAHGKNIDAEHECKTEKRRFIAKEFWDNARKTPEKRRHGQLRAMWRNDELNLKQCRKLINQIKETLRENT